MVQFFLGNIEMISSFSAAFAAIAAAVGLGINTFYQHRQNKSTQIQLKLAEENSCLQKQELERMRKRDDSTHMERVFQEIFGSYSVLTLASEHLSAYKKTEVEYGISNSDFQSKLDLFQFRIGFLEEIDRDILLAFTEYLNYLHSNIANPSDGYAAREEDEALALERGIDSIEWLYLEGEVSRPKMSEPFYWTSVQIILAFRDKALERIQASRIPYDVISGDAELSKETTESISRIVEELKNLLSYSEHIVSKTNSFPVVKKRPVFSREEVHLDSLLVHRSAVISILGNYLHWLSKRYLQDHLS